MIFRPREAPPFSYRVSFINCGSTRRVASAARSDFDIGKLSAGLIGIGSEGGSSNRAWHRAAGYLVHFVWGGVPGREKPRAAAFLPPLYLLCCESAGF